MKLIIASDMIPETLKDTVTFVNSFSDFDIYVLQVQSLKKGNLQIYAPALFGFARKSGTGLVTERGYWDVGEQPIIATRVRKSFGKSIGGGEMALRFRKSKKLGKYGRINLSKSGVGFSFGVPGFRIGISPKGKVRRTIGIPGTGIYDVEEVGPAKPKKANRICHKCNRKAGQKDVFCRYCGVKLQ